jgi:hypothetical protein
MYHWVTVMEDEIVSQPCSCARFVTLFGASIPISWIVAFQSRTMLRTTFLSASIVLPIVTGAGFTYRCYGRPPCSPWIRRCRVSPARTLLMLSGRLPSDFRTVETLAPVQLHVFGHAFHVTGDTAHSDFWAALPLRRVEYSSVARFNLIHSSMSIPWR